MMTKKQQVFYSLLAFVFLISVLAGMFMLVRSTAAREARAREWYISNLKYSFKARIINIEELPQRWGYGYVTCTTEDSIRGEVEDSLQKFVDHEYRFIEVMPNRSIKFLTQNASLLRDRGANYVIVNSGIDSITFLKNKIEVGKMTISKCLKDRGFR
jgi:hypothetical protein